MPSSGYGTYFLDKTLPSYPLSESSILDNIKSLADLDIDGHLFLTVLGTLPADPELALLFAEAYLRLAPEEYIPFGIAQMNLALIRLGRSDQVVQNIQKVHFLSLPTSRPDERWTRVLEGLAEKEASPLKKLWILHQAALLSGDLAKASTAWNNFKTTYENLAKTKSKDIKPYQKIFDKASNRMVRVQRKNATAGMSQETQKTLQNSLTLSRWMHDSSGKSLEEALKDQSTEKVVDLFVMFQDVYGTRTRPCADIFLYLIENRHWKGDSKVSLNTMSAITSFIRSSYSDSRALPAFQVIREVCAKNPEATLNNTGKLRTRAAFDMEFIRTAMGIPDEAQKNFSESIFILAKSFYEYTLADPPVYQGNPDRIYELQNAAKGIYQQAVLKYRGKDAHRSLMAQEIENKDLDENKKSKLIRDQARAQFFEGNRQAALETLFKNYEEVSDAEVKVSLVTNMLFMARSICRESRDMTMALHVFDRGEALIKSGTLSEKKAKSLRDMIAGEKAFYEEHPEIKKP